MKGTVGFGMLCLVLLFSACAPKEETHARVRTRAALLLGSKLLVPVTEFVAMEWSQDGNSLALIDGHTLRSVLDSRKLELEDDYWFQVRWNPDGSKLLVKGIDKAVLVDTKTWTVEKQLEEGENWWFGNLLASADSVEPSSDLRGNVQEWTAGKIKNRLPKSLIVVAASRDGLALLSLDEGKPDKYDDESLWLLLLEERTGRLLSRKELSSGRLDMFGPLEVDWNPSRKLAARTIDNSGGSTFTGLVEAPDWEYELRLVDGENAYFWVSNLRWLDENLLFVSLNISHQYVADQLTTRGFFRNVLALYEADSGRIRPVYESDSMLTAAASKELVAILEKVNENETRLVISEWVRTAAGVPYATRYRPKDEPEEGDYKRFLDHPQKPLPRTRTRPAESL